ncbi:Benzoate carboxyl methyltransferase [Beauveria bassiana D1-5]|uniref:Benzoate carboxyl methyltransferase n=1 Tax=Beauveria bassiana D1-5 TaxID=1245745 RepID=A0A0A2VIG7_BEABA|nr:Benzoate carboxyl methyltransferase [Beauveria bassiana D1-5]
MHPAIEEWAKNYPYARVFPQMIARSFYQQIIPDGQVHFGFSFSCLQWLSQFPQAHVSDGEPIVDRVSLMSFRQNICRDQSDRDLHQFLQVRGNEFVPGGSLILSFIGSSSVCGYWETPVLKCLVLALDEMVADGLIKLATADLFSPPVFTRDLQQVRAVLDSPEVQSVWSTMHLFEEDVEHPMSSNLDRQGKSLEESTQYAQEMIDFGLAIVANFLMDAIRAQNRADSITVAEEEELLVQWKTRAANIFLRQCRDARVSFRWVYVSLKRTAQAS